MADSTVCKACGRAVFAAHVDAKGRCILCSPAAAFSSKPAKVTDEEWADLGRPVDK